MRLIDILGTALGRSTDKRFLPLQPGDVPATYADVDELIAAVGFVPRTTIEAASNGSFVGIAISTRFDGGLAKREARVA